MRIVVYTREVKKVSGIQTFERNFCKSMRFDNEVIYLYNTGDSEKLLEIEASGVKCVQNRGQLIEADICIYSSALLGHPEPNVRARKSIQIVHADMKKWHPGYKPRKVDYHVAVGEAVKENLKKDFNIDSIVIPNPLWLNRGDRVLRLMTASRIAKEKGFERIVEIAKRLKSANKKFIWEIYGSGATSYQNQLFYSLQKAGINEVHFMGAKDQIQSYMEVNDYVVQLSDHEGYCYSIYEALQVGVPVIVTNWPGVEKVVKHGKNGYIIDMELSNFSVNEIYEIPGSFKFNDSAVKKWQKFLNKIA